MITATLMIGTVTAQTGVSGSSERERVAAAREAAGATRERSRSADNQYAENIAAAYAQALYLTEKEAASIRDRIAGMGREMDAALAQLAKAKLQVDNLLEAEMKKIDEGFSKEQQEVLRQQRVTGDWICTVDPCECALQPNSRSRNARPAARPTPGTRSTTPEKGDGSRISPDGGRPAKR